MPTPDLAIHRFTRNPINENPAEALTFRMKISQKYQKAVFVV
jgi:hypothetical protein